MPSLISAPVESGSWNHLPIDSTFSYARLRPAANSWQTYTISPATDTVIIRIIFSLSKDLALSGTSYPIVCKSDSTNIVRYALFSNGAQGISALSGGSTINPYTTGLSFPRAASMNEIWLVWKHGTVILAGNIGAGNVVRDNINNSAYTINTIQIGRDASISAGEITFHKIDIWTSKITDISKIVPMAGAYAYVDEPAILSVLDTPTKEPTSIDFTRPDGTTGSIAQFAVGMTRTGQPSSTDVKQNESAILYSYGNLEEDQTYKDCLVRQTTDGFNLLPMSLCICQPSGYAMCHPFPVSLLNEVSGFSSNSTHFSDTTFELTTYHEISNGVYIFAIPRTVFTIPGNYFFQINYANESFTLATFVCKERPHFVASTPRPAGLYMSFGFDDGYAEQFAQVDVQTFPIKPYVSTAMGLTGQNGKAGTGVLRLAKSWGWSIYCHLWNNTRTDEYASKEIAEMYIRAAYDCIMLEELDTHLFVSPGGASTFPGGGDIFTFCRDYFGGVRGSSSIFVSQNTINLDSDDLKSRSIGNTVPYTGGSDAGTVAEILGAIATENHANGIAGIQFHFIGTTTGSATITSETLIAALLAETTYRYIHYNDYFFGQPDDTLTGFLLGWSI